MVTEARLLRQHKGRLEARMTVSAAEKRKTNVFLRAMGRTVLVFFLQVLEDHNRQLETQLSRLRVLLQQQQSYILKK